jgi:ankyrin repeat protein
MPHEQALLNACVTQDASLVSKLLHENPNINVNVCQNVSVPQPYTILKQEVPELFPGGAAAGHSSPALPQTIQIKTTPLIYAARIGDINIVKHLLAHPRININQTNPRCVDPSFYSALHAACFGGHIEVIEALVRHRTSLNTHYSLAESGIPGGYSRFGRTIPNFFTLLCQHACLARASDVFPHSLSPAFFISTVKLLLTHTFVDIYAAYPFLYLACHVSNNPNYDSTQLDLLHLFIAVHCVRTNISIEDKKALDGCINKLLGKYSDTDEQIQHTICFKAPYQLTDIKKQITVIQGTSALYDKAAQLYMLIIFLCDGLLKLRKAVETPTTKLSLIAHTARNLFTSEQPIASAETARFFHIVSQLPIELQDLVTKKYAGSSKENLPSGNYAEKTASLLAQKYSSI